MTKYYELAFRTAGVLLIRKNKPNSGFPHAKTKDRTLLLHCVVCSHLKRAREEYLGDLPFHAIERGETPIIAHAIICYMKAYNLKNSGNPPRN